MKNLNAFNEYSNKENDNIDTIPGMAELLTDFVESLDLPFEAYEPSIEMLEYKSRDGFHAHNHNRGGVDLIAMTSDRDLLGSGEHIGLLCQDQVEKIYDYSIEYLKEENPDMDHESEEFIDLVYESLSDDSSHQAWRVRIMYEGNGKLCIHTGFDHDAPYFRWRNAADFEKEISFKTLSGLARQLKALKKTIENSAYSKK